MACRVVSRSPGLARLISALRNRGEIVVPGLPGDAEARRGVGCDLVIANDVSPATGIMGGGCNSVHIVSKQGVDTWPSLPKEDVASRLVFLFAGML